MTRDVNLSRRKTLLGLATIGAAGAGAGLGTSALFSDTESFEGNSITAGTLDMQVTASVVAHVDNDYWNSLSFTPTTVDGSPGVAIDVEDIKPGDWAICCFDVEVTENPGYVQAEAANLVTTENGLAEPESAVDSSGGDPGQGNGELQDHLLAEVYADFDSSANGNPPRSHLSPDGGDPVAPEGSTLQGTYDAFETGVLLRDANGDPVEAGSGSDSVTWYVLYYLPEGVGNVVQSDGCGFDLVFHTEQVRNNDTPFSS